MSLELAPTLAADLRRAAARGRLSVARFDSVAALAGDAGGALDRARQPSLYDRIDWLAALEAHALVGSPLHAVRARLGDGTAWLFLATEKRGRAKAFATWYTLAFAPVFADAPDAATRKALLTAIARALRFGQVALSPLPEPAMAELADAFRAAGWRARAEISSQNWVADVAGLDFAAYWAKRPSKLRNTVRRKGKGSPYRLDLIDAFDEAAWSAYEAVYAQSWKPAEGSPAFVRAMAEREGAAGTLRMGIAWRDERPVAAQFWTVEQGVASIHKLAYVEDERPGSPGTLLSEAMFAHVIGRDAPDLIDFGTGDDGYKADWMDRKLPLYRLDLYNLRRPRGIWLACRAALARAAKRLRRR